MKYEELEILVKDEITQREEEGCEVEDFKEELKKIKTKSPKKLEQLLKNLAKLSVRRDFPYKEPSTLEEIRAERPKKQKTIKFELNEEQIYDKIFGGWLGRCAGCLLGKPVEGLTKEQIEEWLKAAGKYPLSNYFPPLHGIKELPDWLKRRTSWTDVLLGHINHMPRDDDIDYPIINLHLLETRGFEFTTADVGNIWLENLPYFKVYTAERVAYRNLVNGLVPPETALYLNPYREWIGAQIRADIFGYVTPGMPEIGAELAYRDASLSHVKNGIYGEMFVAAMISAAFVTDDIEEIIDFGLSEIPQKSRLYEAMKNVVAWSKKYDDWRGAWQKIFDEYGHYHGVHTINNAALVLLGLLYGKGDYEKSITISVMGGWDTDCNGATTGSILGVMLGAKKLPKKWIDPLNNTVESYVVGYNNSKISDLAQRTFILAQQVKNNYKKKKQKKQ
ncbi:MAG: ADP-ribosylglycohydrolase family protein [Candidatus Bathyarchaeia archaeon]